MVSVTIPAQLKAALEYLEGHSHEDIDFIGTCAVQVYGDYRDVMEIAEMLHFTKTGFLPEWGLVIESVEVIGNARLWVHAGN